MGAELTRLLRYPELPEVIDTCPLGSGDAHSALLETRLRAIVTAAETTS